MEYVIKRIHPNGVAAALQKADKYRELNQPAEAESICRDVLDVAPDNQLALRTLGLALSDQFEPAAGARFSEAQEIFARLGDPYEQAFYGGLVCERQAKVQLAAHFPVNSVRPLFDRALACYEEAERLHPRGNDDPILRWNSCVRAVKGLPGFGTPEVEPGADWEMDSVPHER